MAEKVQGVLQQINTLTEGGLTDLLVRKNHCPNCLEGSLERKDEDLCCTTCGFVVEDERFSMNIPFGSQNSPGNSLAFGNGMGGTLQKKGTFCVLAKNMQNAYKITCPQCGLVIERNDLPLSAQHVGTITEKYEHPKMASLLRFGRQRAIDWGYDLRKSRKGIVFSNHYAKNVLRPVGDHIICQNLRVNFQKVADACLAVALNDLLGSEACQEAVDKLKIEERLLKDIMILRTMKVKT